MGHLARLLGTLAGDDDRAAGARADRPDPGARRLRPARPRAGQAHLFAWPGTGLDDALRAGGVDTLVITGAETDVCVLAAVLGAVDLGYRVIVVTDGLCSSSDESHDALLGLYRDRYGQQVETAESAEVLANWA